MSEPPSTTLPPDKILDYGKELWTLGNLVAGFCIVQTILFLEEAGKHCSALGIEVARHGGWYGMGGVALFLAGELALVWMCHWGHTDVLNMSGYSIPCHLRKMFLAAVRIRTGIIIISLAFSLVFIAHSAWVEQRGSIETIKACNLKEMNGA
jgi:hypothetical protein